MAVQPPAISQKEYTLCEVVKETPDVDTVKFKPSDDYRLAFDPGMFVMITYVNPQTKEKVTRAFSIASAPDKEILEFEIHMIRGRFTAPLEDSKIGDVFYFTGPYGQFKFLAATDRKVLFIAGGTGIAPFLSMLRQIEENNHDVDISLVYSVRFPNEIIRKQELEGYEQSIKMKMMVTVTRPQEGDGWTGETGHINAEMIGKHVTDAPERTCYICGPLAFVKAARDALATLNVPTDKVKADVWG